ncbi:hypothetical protein EDD27_5687 [Nonomuraea polychroma]|uniref:Uncharacterized protein n=1 Tax=Nonomuraea polychroma TaxID=46176 RepID=A0A438MBB9_9ACTN|nr:hypothetical protein [Nonomuraea polychroma]RVX43020.1 hypothetical protein EDD27_5687 [Nonomuraea polychroma]
MDSHGSASPISPARTGVTSRPAGGDVTRHRQAVYVPEFRDVEQMPDGSWSAVHHSGQEVTAPTLRNLVYVVAPAVRIAPGWRRRS